MDKSLALNFSPLKCQDFQFTIYRKIRANGEKKESFSFPVIDRALPVNIGSDAPFLKYWVSFTPQEQFEIFSCKSSDNHFLTSDYLFLQLKRRCAEVLSSNEYYSDESFFSQRIKFVISTHKEGKQIVWVEPYYLRETKKIGFLIDFKFDKIKDQPFNKKMVLQEFRW